MLNVNNISLQFGKRVLFDDVNINFNQGNCYGVIGANGAGKSTLFKMLTKHETPDKGSIEIGETVNLACVDQSRDALDDNKTVWEEIADGLDTITVGKFTIPSRQYVGRFNFKGGDQQKYISQLSGGERNRVHLAKLLRSGGNVILLDEPTNDLDVETLRALEEAILAFPGCIMVISHDRWFLNRVATHMLAFEGESEVVWFEGNYDAYIEDKKRRLGDKYDAITKIKYKRISV